MWHDLRYGARTLLKNPRFTVIALLVLALGIGANTAVFSIVHGVLLRPLAYRDPGRLMVVMANGQGNRGMIPTSPGDYIEYRDQNHSFEAIAAAQLWGPTLSGTDEPEQITAVRSTPELFRILGVPAALGRTFSPEHGEAGNERVVILSDKLWRRRFNGSPDVVGRKVGLNGEPYTVLAVMPPRFQFPPFWATKAEAWAPLVFPPDALQIHGSHSLRLFARLKAGVTLEQARTDIESIASRLQQQYPRSNAQLGARIDPLMEVAVGDIRPMLVALAGAVAFILLLTCANVANLLLARASGRRREIAVRLALGANRSVLIRQLLCESVLLSVTGGAIGLLLAWLGVRLMLSNVPDIARFALPRREEVAIDPMAVAFALGLSMAASILFGLIPALQASRTDVNNSLKEGGRNSAGGSQGRLRSILVTAEFALALVLLAGAGLMIRSLRNQQALEPGFRTQNVLTTIVPVAGTRFAEPARRVVFYRQLVDRVSAIPGVLQASAVNHIPIGGDMWGTRFVAQDKAPPAPGEVPGATFRVAMPNYFRAMGITLLEGRDIEWSDNQTAAGVVVINEAMAKRTWPGESALGKRIKLGNPESNVPWLTVIGVVGNVRQWEWTVEAQNELYVPYLQDPGQTQSPQPSTMTLVAHTAPAPAKMLAAVREEVRRIDANLPMAEVKAMDEVVASVLWQPRFSMGLLTLFAAFALTLAAVGVYGVMSQVVSQRTGEIGIRMALGARPGDVLAMVGRQGLILCGAGAAAGLAGALMLTRFLTTQLYHVSPHDPLTLAVIPLVLLGAALVACWFPARRATRIDPIVALRCE